MSIEKVECLTEVFELIDQLPEVELSIPENDLEATAILDILYLVPNLWKTNKLTESTLFAQQSILQVRLLASIYGLDFKELVKASFEHRRAFHKSILIHAWWSRPIGTTSLRDGLIRALSASMSPFTQDFLYAPPLLKSLIKRNKSAILDNDVE